MGLYEGRGQLVKSMKGLMLRWNETRNSWDDAQSEHFEEKFIQPLEQDLRTALAAMDHIAALVQQARRDCE